MHARSGRSSNARRGARRKLVWADYQSVLSFTANGQWETVDLLQQYKAIVGAPSAGVTIMRTHLTVWPLVTATGDIVWTGLKVDDSTALSGTPTTNGFVPNPRDEPNQDWMLAREWLANPTYQYGGNQLEIDLRAKRRMEEVQQAYILSFLQAAVGTVAASYRVHARTLLALP